MPDLEAIIAAQVAEAEQTGEVPDDPSAHIDPDEGEVETEVVEEKPDGKTTSDARNQSAKTKTDETPALGDPKPESEDDIDKTPALDQRKRENRIPHGRVVKMVETGVKKFVREVLGKDPEANKPLVEQVKSYVTRLPELETKVKAYEEEVAPMRSLGQIMATDGKKFIQILQSAYPEQYRDLFGPPPPPAEFKPDYSTMPAPDYKLPDGSMTYSLEGNKKLMEWNTQQIIAKVREEARAEVEKTNKPFSDSIAAQKQISAANQRIATQMAEARTWDGFQENEKEIIDVINKATAEKRRISIDTAYAQVMNSKRKAAEESAKVDKEKLRKEILAEIKAAPNATAVSTTTKKVEEAEVLSEADGGDDAVTAAIKKAIKSKLK